MSRELLSTKQVAEFLNINEKMVYTLISEKNLPATKVTGKWLFPIDLVRQWIEAGTVNYPEPVTKLPPYHGLILIAGSNDLLLDKMISIFNSRFKEHLAMFGFTGSMGGLKALRQNHCHIASSHLVAENNEEYNFPYLEMEKMPAVVNFCLREQGILVKKGNPENIKSVADLGRSGIKIVNRALGTGTRQLFEKKLKKAGVTGEDVTGFDNIVLKHMDIGLSILKGDADAGPGIKPVASNLGLDFIPICKERFDLLISKERFFDQGIQLFLGLLKEKFFKEIAKDLGGYDLSMSGAMVYSEKEADPE
ncbi:MAG: helix-turn-helix transcriptional regulator [Thermodesulfobacteriota bacterium]|nr:helix-turn-helix transcriptional regulator [Thermodesulfobacteriota bacterium]